MTCFIYKSRMSSWILILLVGVFFAACDQKPEQRANKDKKDTTSKTTNSEQAADSKEAVDDELAGDNQEPVDDEFVDDEGESEDGPTIEELVASCGGEEAMNATADQVIYEKSVNSIEVKKKVAVVNIKANTKLDIKVTGSKTVQTMSLDVEALGLFSPFAKGTINTIKEKNAGAATFTNVPFKDYAELSSKYKSWKGVLCTFIPATKLVNERGGKTVSSFDPPLPASISPKAAKERFDEEIGQKRVFQGIKVKIESSDNVELKGKTELDGSVTTEKVSASAKIEVPGQDKPININADIAFKVSYNFGTPEMTLALGIPPEVTYYISFAKKDLVATLIDTKDKTLGQILFVY